MSRAISVVALKKLFTISEKSRTFAVGFSALKMINTFVDTKDDTDVMEMQDDLTPEQRAYWESVIERDMRDRDKTKNYLTLDEFEQKLTAAAIKLYA